LFAKFRQSDQVFWEKNACLQKEGLHFEAWGQALMAKRKSSPKNYHFWWSILAL